MTITFYKYQGTGNDFILIDNRDKSVRLATRQIERLCNRHFGIGADGLMLLEQEAGYDFKMVYYNADGNESTMCGNGGRCITAFAKMLGVIQSEAKFIAIDGSHTATVNEDDTISLQMKDVKGINSGGAYTLLDTGSPHHVVFVPDIAGVAVVAEGRNIRNWEAYQPKGINVNFAQQQADGLAVRTYERGVEDETLSCGTGVTAAAIASCGTQTGEFNIPITTPGGKLRVSFSKPSSNEAIHVMLTGAAHFVFKGMIALSGIQA